jgi:hypothetical protein
MLENKMILIPQRTHQAFCQMFSGLPRDQINALSDMVDEILLKVGRGGEIVDYYAPVKEVEKIFLKKTANYSKDRQVILRRSLVAKMALNSPTIVEKMDLPKSILVLYPDAFDRLADHLKTNRDDPYDSTDDFFLKDIRFVLALSIPCSVTHVLDMISKVSLRSVILSLFRLRNVNAIIRYARIKGYGPWFRVHTDPRRLNDFSEQGWDNCFLRIAELLERKKDIRGMVGTSWFYDPQLLKISPRLAYLRQRPLERGAFLLRHRTGGIDIENATMKSETRLRLYQEGKYTPIVLSIVWPRKDLISWADQARRGK